DVKFTVDVAPVDTDVTVLSAVFFVVREAVSNALRHGQPKTVAIELRQIETDALALQVSDDGSGSAGAVLKPGFGMRGMEERIARLGGILTIGKRSDGPGLVVRAKLPAAAEAPSGFANDVGTNTGPSQSSATHTSAAEERPLTS
ncbi:MAG: hypothetical protein K0U34_06755, partial [Alphaproteobacteria bacterium]|nr:hypothetical protein [Alphaproteobacteria bacterium]